MWAGKRSPINLRAKTMWQVATLIDTIRFCVNINSILNVKRENFIPCEQSKEGRYKFQSAPGSCVWVCIGLQWCLFFSHCHLEKIFVNIHIKKGRDKGMLSRYLKNSRAFEVSKFHHWAHVHAPDQFGSLKWNVEWWIRAM